MNDLFSVKGKVAVVTGGSRGIGAMIARGFVANGVKTYITARKVEELQATAEALSEFGECIAIASDLSTLEGIKAFVAELKEKESKLHILVNNAGATWGEHIDEFPESGWDKVMDLNAKSPFFLIQQCLPLMREAGTPEDPSRVINISSINAYANPGMDNYSYSASKAAIAHLTRHLAADLVGDNINVNGIAPGLFPSKMTAFIINEHEEASTANIPRGRVGNASDAAGTAIYLCAKASAWVTGHTVILDGGVVANAG
ncbi:SDR family oxidoreductase [Maricurvus nonylphenolicus]|uniref:SDR family oxidoreductase n=1 Tax=Maricurvus nonylphenolicus TaxID=1008307 RepID=UPI0036F2B77C